ncbi:MAG: glycosyl transferase group 1 [Chloroflexota bacterium]|nr:glycosyl transferase group 1 [Chloroflexota bacterium]
MTDGPEPGPAPGPLGRAEASAMALGKGRTDDLPPGVRVVMDVRALQEPARAPRTASYLDGLLGGFDADPRPGESFAFLLASDEDDPTPRFEHLEVVGRRLLPPVRLLRQAALTVDPFVLRGASVGAAWRADRSGAAGAVYHAAGNAVPIASRLPTVVTLLDLAPWELPEAFQRGTTSRFGQRLRARLLRDAAAILVGTEAVAKSARRLLHLRRDRIHVVPLAPRPAYAAVLEHALGRRETARAAADRLGLGDRYLVYHGRHDIRQDGVTLMAALASLASTDRPAGLADAADWPPRLLVVDATPDDRAALARIAARHDASNQVVYAPILPADDTAAIVAAARAVVLPVVSEASGLVAIDSLAAGVPVIASAVGALPEIVGSAGILVEPRDRERLAVAMATAWSDEPVRAGIAAAARSRGTGPSGGPRSWVDVANEVRAIYATVAR